MYYFPINMTLAEQLLNRAISNQVDNQISFINTFNYIFLRNVPFSNKVQMRKETMINLLFYFFDLITSVAQPNLR